MAAGYGHLYELPEYEAWLWADAAGFDPRAEHAHPGIAYMVGLHGGGASIQDILNLLGADADSGVLFGEIELEFERPLEGGVTYEVDGEITAVERKTGRRAGTFDRVTFEHRVRTRPDGEAVATIGHTWIFPRATPE